MPGIGRFGAIDQPWLRTKPIRQRPAATVVPRRAKEVLRNRFGNPSPKTLGFAERDSRRCGRS
jgi:hypothetical protein